MDGSAMTLRVVFGRSVFDMNLEVKERIMLYGAVSFKIYALN